MPKKKKKAPLPTSAGHPVFEPAHYTNHNIEPLDVIEDWELGFHLGNVVKYIARYKYKGAPRQDLEKAQEYLSRFIQIVLKD